MDICWINAGEVNDVEHLNDQIGTTSCEYICIALPVVWQKMSQDVIREALTKVQVMHAGLKVGGGEAFEALTAVSFNWNFLAPDNDRDNYSWKATEHFMAFRTETFRILGGFDQMFSFTASLAEFCYRAMKSGGVVKYIASLIPEPETLPVTHVTSVDVVRFAEIHLSPNHARLLKALFLFRFKPVRLSVKTPATIREETALSGIVRENLVRVVGDYTAIIPTILRYDYIGKSIESLLIHEYPPKEIIVVDQSPGQLRQPQVYQPYIDKGLLRVFFLDEAGQSTSRNLAIQEAKTEWLLFFEDDTEAWSGMMREHRYLLGHSFADVSTGVSLAPWKDESYIPRRLKKYHVSDVLATGNCFMKRETALEVNGLHMAFNRGSGADDDFGRRLFLAGKLIIFNFKAIQTHHKASSGGMRVHGAWWRNTSSLLGAYPPPTQMFMMNEYYKTKFRTFQILYFFGQLKKRSSTSLFLFSIILLPIKVIRSFWATRSLQRMHGKI